MNVCFRSTHKKLEEVGLNAYHLAGDGEDGSYFFIDDISDEEIGKLNDLKIKYELTENQPTEFEIQPMPPDQISGICTEGHENEAGGCCCPTHGNTCGSCPEHDQPSPPTGFSTQAEYLVSQPSPPKIEGIGNFEELAASSPAWAQRLKKYRG